MKPDIYKIATIIKLSNINENLCIKNFEPYFEKEYPNIIDMGKWSFYLIKENEIFISFYLWLVEHKLNGEKYLYITK